MRDGDYSCAKTSQARMRDIDTIDSELRLVAALRRAARERGVPLPSIDVADALLDERREVAELWNQIGLVVGAAVSQYGDATLAVAQAFSTSEPPGGGTSPLIIQRSSLVSSAWNSQCNPSCFSM